MPQHYLVDPTGAILAELPSSIMRVIDGTWAPDSQAFLYKRSGGNAWQIAIFNLPTLEVKLVPLEMPDNTNPGTLLWDPLG